MPTHAAVLFSEPNSASSASHSAATPVATAGCPDGKSVRAVENNNIQFSVLFSGQMGEVRTLVHAYRSQRKQAEKIKGARGDRGVNEERGYGDTR